MDNNEELKELEDLNNYSSFKTVWFDLKFGKQWQSLSYFKLTENFDLGLIKGVKKSENSEESEEFYILPANEKEEWSLERYSLLFDTLKKKEIQPTFDRFNLKCLFDKPSLTKSDLYKEKYDSTKRNFIKEIDVNISILTLNEFSYFLPLSTNFGRLRLR
ncbi:hypothetical protein K502DRAFT_362704 [Neoconidiobolus thromboides FSU 785]|nr:hypothetical protein K502DRAFT_362704 [Neoconidiobolus thromboides FSU 785]